MLGGWLALVTATRHPERVDALLLLCPGGVGRHRNILLWALPLPMPGPWGRRKLSAIITGPAARAQPLHPAAAQFLSLIYRHFRPRTERIPIASDAALRRLVMPVLAILGAEDVMVDSPGIARRLEENVPRAEIRILPHTGHAILNQTQPILDFLRNR